MKANRFSSGTLIGWKFGQTAFLPLWDRMEGAWLWTERGYGLRSCRTASGAGGGWGGGVHAQSHPFHYIYYIYYPLQSFQHGVPIHSPYFYSTPMHSWPLAY
jgi:hypothetical protein